MRNDEVLDPVCDRVLVGLSGRVGADPDDPTVIIHAEQQMTAVTVRDRGQCPADLLPTIPVRRNLFLELDLRPFSGRDQRLDDRDGLLDDLDIGVATQRIAPVTTLTEIPQSRSPKFPT